MATSTAFMFDRPFPVKHQRGKSDAGVIEVPQRELAVEMVASRLRSKDMKASALLLTQNVQVQSVISSILAELSIETKLFTDVPLAQVALSGARFVAVVVDCDLAGADSPLNREGSPSNREALRFN